MQKWMRNSFLQVEDRFEFVFQEAAMIMYMIQCWGVPPGHFLYYLIICSLEVPKQSAVYQGIPPGLFSGVLVRPESQDRQKLTKEVHCDDVELTTVETTMIINLVI